MYIYLCGVCMYIHKISAKILKTVVLLSCTLYYKVTCPFLFGQQRLLAHDKILVCYVTVSSHILF